jgi:hypothetical protein
MCSAQRQLSMRQLEAAGAAHCANESDLLR